MDPFLESSITFQICTAGSSFRRSVASHYARQPEPPLTPEQDAWATTGATQD
jgi:hypothetical protein